MNERDIRLQSLRQAATARYRNGEFEAAEQLIGEALKLDPNSPELWSNRGTAQVAAKRQEAALASFTRALELAPDFLGALANRAHVLFELQRYAEAIPDYERFLARDPGHAYSAGNLVFCRLQCCDWTSFEHDRKTILARLRAGQRVVPPVLSAALLESPADQLIAAQVLARDKFPAAPPLWRGETYRHERIRVAYVSADFHAHATAVLMAGVFEHHDRAKFETFAISFGRDDGSPLRARLKQGIERFVDVRGQSDADIARLMRGLEIDIAVDLKGYTSEARPAVFSAPACAGAGQLSRIPGHDGRAVHGLSDRRSDRRAGRRTSRSTANRSSGFPTPIRQTTERGRPATRRSIARARDCRRSGFVFCCFNNSYKIQPPDVRRLDAPAAKA